MLPHTSRSIEKRFARESCWSLQRPRSPTRKNRGRPIRNRSNLDFSAGAAFDGWPRVPVSRRAVRKGARAFVDAGTRLIGAGCVARLGVQRDAPGYVPICQPESFSCSVELRRSCFGAMEYHSAKSPSCLKPRSVQTCRMRGSAAFLTVTRAACNLSASCAAHRKMALMILLLVRSSDPFRRS